MVLNVMCYFFSETRCIRLLGSTPLFRLQGFQAFEPPFFQLRFLKTKDKNKITGNNQTSFIEIDPCKLQPVRRSVLISQHNNSR